jgi:hypothetical protein
VTRYSIHDVAVMLGHDPVVVAYLVEAGALPGPGAATSTRREREQDGMWDEADLGMVRRAANGGLCSPKCSGLGRRSNRAPDLPPGVDPRNYRVRLVSPKGSR